MNTARLIFGLAMSLHVGGLSAWAGAAEEHGELAASSTWFAEAILFVAIAAVWVGGASLVGRFFRAQRVRAAEKKPSN